MLFFYAQKERRKDAERGQKEVFLHRSYYILVVIYVIWKTMETNFSEK